jgi:hypothetical protein
MGRSDRPTARASAYDALTAATTIANCLPGFTCNPADSDFDRVVDSPRTEDGSFSVSYPAADSAYNVTRDSHVVTADLTGGRQLAPGCEQRLHAGADARRGCCQ